MGSVLIDMMGQVFGRWKVIARAEGDPSSNSTYWSCVCRCGNHRVVDGSSLRRGTSVSCGCHRAEVMGRIKRKHGMTGTSEYKIWGAMIRRCYSPQDSVYHNYGGRGIKVCDRWRNSFEAFLQDMGRRPANKSIDRIDNNGNYEPGNCRWASALVQTNNMRTNRILELDGKSRTLAEWARHAGMSAGVLRGRLTRGWSLDEAIRTPDGERRANGK